MWVKKLKRSIIILQSLSCVLYLTLLKMKLVNMIENFLKFFSVFAPHIAEELWNSFIDSKTLISVSSWPVADDSKINEEIDKAEENFERTISDVQNVLKIVNDKQGKEVKYVYLYVIPNELSLFNKDSKHSEHLK